MGTGGMGSQSSSPEHRPWTRCGLGTTAAAASAAEPHGAPHTAVLAKQG